MPFAPTISRSLERGLALISIHDLFEEQVRSAPKAKAVTFEEESISYAELNRRANRLALRLLQWVQPESLIGLLADRSIEMVVGILGILKAGGAYVPIDPACPADRRTFMLRDSKVKALLTQKDFRDEAGEYAGPVLYLDDDIGGNDADEAFVSVRVNPENAAYVIYTSGSTGKPKGVVVTHGNVLRLMRKTERHYQFGAHDVWTMFHSYGFDFSVWEIWGALLYGGRLVVVPYWVSRSAEDFLELVIQEKVTVLNQTPSVFRHFSSAEEKRTIAGKAALRFVIFGGEALDFASLRRWMERHGDDDPEVVNMYGITETTVHVTYRRVRKADVEQGETGSLIGAPISDLQVYVLDEEMNSVPKEIAGEMYVGGRGVTRGYLNRPDLTAERFVPDPFSGVPGARLYRTGDRAKFLSGNELAYLGRGDNQVKIRGFRIELGEIEAVLSERENIRESAVVVEEDQFGDKLLAAYVTAVGTVPKKELRKYLETRLPDYMVPTKIVVLDRLPLTENGKLDRKRLGQKATATLKDAAADRYVGPRNELEQRIASIWAEVLGVERLGIHDSFFDHGGHSMHVMQMTSKMRLLLNGNINLKDIFECPTPHTLALRVQTLLRQSAPVETEPLVRRNLSKAPLSFPQRIGWFLTQVMPEHAFPMPLAHRLEGKLDLAALERSVNQIIRRHEILRTRFVEIKDEPWQVIEPELSIKIQFEDLSNYGADQREATLRVRLHEEGRRGFDVGRLPLFRVCVFQRGPHDQALLVTMHHMIGDGWSMKVFYRELEILYAADGRSEEANLREPTVQYGDFAWWQSRRFENGAMERELDYWRRQLSGAPNALQIPSRVLHRGPMTYNAANKRFDLDEATTQALRNLSRRMGVTFYMILLSALAVLLNRFSGEEDILIGTPVALRMHEDLQNVMGIFLNMILMRIDLSGNPRFPELAKRVRETALAAYSHHEVPLERVVQELRPGAAAWRDLDRAPLSQIMFNMLDADDRAINLPGTRSTQINVDDGAAKFGLTCEIQDHKSHLHIRIVHREAAFENGAWRDIHLRFGRLLGELAKKPDCPIDDLDMVLPHERMTTSEPALIEEIEAGFLL